MGSSNSGFLADYVRMGGEKKFLEFKQTLMEEINHLAVPGLPVVTNLHALAGHLVNLAYPLPSGQAVKFLNDGDLYLATQVESSFGGDRYFVVVAGQEFLLVSTCGKEREAPELVVYRGR